MEHSSYADTVVNVSKTATLGASKQQLSTMHIPNMGPTCRRVDIIFRRLVSTDSRRCRSILDEVEK